MLPDAADVATLRMLGPLEIAVDGCSVHPGGPKQRAILAYLVLHAGEPVSVAALVDAAWGDDAPDAAVRSIRTYVSSLRRIFGPTCEITGERGTYRLDLRSAGTDVDEFRALTHRAAAVADCGKRSELFAAALDLWRGPFLADLDHPWVAPEANEMEWERRRATVAWADATIDDGRPEETIATLDGAVAEAPLDEGVCGRLMRALYGAGRQADALAVYRRLRDGLVTELGVEPGADLKALEQRILLHDASLDASEPEWLPAPSAGLIGRSVEIEDLLVRCERSRLVTLTGPGGVGKTRLAIEVGRRSLERGDRTVCFADLSTVVDEPSVAAAMASSAGVQTHPSTELWTDLINYLRPRDVLFIVDNCEQVGHAVARMVTALVRHCPHVTVVATSRAPLHVDGEHEWRTPPLQFPDRPDGDHLGRWSAVELLTARAPSSFRLTDSNAGDVVGLCRRLDGLPLALEIAASRLGTMTPAEIVAALGAGRPISRSHVADDARQHTLHATIDWSFRLLDDDGRGLLARLGVMNGRFTLDDVVAVCAADRADPAAVQDRLSALVDQSLLMAETSGPRTRYRLLETIRSFALDRLGDELPGLRRRHAHYFAGVAEREAARLVTADEREAAVALAVAYDNLHGAAAWAMEAGDVETTARIVASGPDWGYWRSHYELSRWARWAWETIDANDPRWRAVCGSAARGAWLAGRFDDAVRFGRAGADAAGTVVARSGHPDDVVADVALYRGDTETALAHYTRVRAAAEQAGDTTRAVWATYYVAVIAAVLRRPDAVDIAADALAGARSTGNPTSLAFSLYASGLAVKHRSPGEAGAMFGEAARVADSVDNAWFAWIARMELASTLATHGDLDVGLRTFAEVIDYWHRVGDDTQLRLTWRYLVGALLDAGLADEAAIVAGALMAERGSALTRPHRQVLDRMRDELGDDDLRRLTVRGSVLSLAELVATSLTAIGAAVDALADRRVGDRLNES